MRGSRSMKNRGRNRKSNKVSLFHWKRIRFAARKVMAMTVSEKISAQGHNLSQYKSSFALSKFSLNGIVCRIVSELLLQKFWIYDFCRSPETRSGKSDSMICAISQICRLRDKFFTILFWAIKPFWRCSASHYQSNFF